AAGATKGLDRIFQRMMEEERLRLAQEQEANDLEIRRGGLANQTRATTSNIGRDASLNQSDMVDRRLGESRIKLADQEAELGGHKLRVIEGLTKAPGTGMGANVPSNDPA